MRPFREQRVETWKLIAGPRYSENSFKKRRYLNLSGLYLSIVSRNLITKEPRVMYSTFSRSDEGAVQAMQEWANEELVRMGFADEMTKIVMNALAGPVGISKVCLASPAACAMAGWNLEPGDPFMRSVDFDDFVWDMTARHPDEVGYIGNRFRAPLEVIQDSKMFNKKARENLTAAEEADYNAEGDEKISSIGRSNYRLSGEFEEMVDLWEIYCPRRKCIYLLTEDNLSGPSASSDGTKIVPLLETDWIGHERGPYRTLCFSPVSGNLMGKGPILDTIDLDEDINLIIRKLFRQAARLKDNTFCPKGNSDNETIKNANDGDLVPVDNPDMIRPVTQGGPNQLLFLFQQAMVKLYDWAAGNLSSMGGLAAQAGTLGQEELLAQQSNGQIAGMQSATACFVGQNCESLNWYWWKHPRKIMQSKFHVDGMPDIWTTRTLKPWDAQDEMDPQTGAVVRPLRRDGPMPSIKIDAYSLRHTTPQQKAQEITQIVTQIFVPMMQLARAQGLGFDFNAFLDIISKYRDLPEIRKILMTIEAPAEEMGMSSGGPKAPSETTRNYVRSDTGNNTQQAQSAQMETMIEGAPQMNGQANGQY